MRQLPAPEAGHAACRALDNLEMPLAWAGMVQTAAEARVEPGGLGGPGAGAVGEAGDVVRFEGEGGEIDVDERVEVCEGAFLDVECCGSGHGGGFVVGDAGSGQSDGS